MACPSCSDRDILLCAGRRLPSNLSGRLAAVLHRFHCDPIGAAGAHRMRPAPDRGHACLQGGAVRQGRMASPHHFLIPDRN